MTYDPQKHHRRSIRLKGYDLFPGRGLFHHHLRPGSGLPVWRGDTCQRQYDTLLPKPISGQIQVRDTRRIVEQAE